MCRTFLTALTEQQPSPNDPFAALRIREFSYFTLARFALVLGIRMQAVIVGWQVYKITGDEWSLGLVGLAEAIPFIAISLFGGHIADIIDRKKIIIATTLLLTLCTAALWSFSLDGNEMITLYGAMPVYSVIFVTGIARAFMGPSYFAYLAQIVPRSLLANSTTWNTTAWHTADIVGPVAGGLILASSTLQNAYAIDTFLIFTSIFFILPIKARPMPPVNKQESIWESLGTGIRFVFGNQIMLGALSLDLFAVLFGGAMAMLPAFAELLEQDAVGFGILRAAPAAGAILMAVIMAYRSPMIKAGRNLFFSVFAFGACTIAFAYSEYFWLSVILLALTGAFDNVSVVIRHTILQMMTPENMRGRVSSVNSIFIGSSNEIGAFESGAAARLMGLVPSVAFGGAMTMLVVGAIAALAPKLRKMKQ